MAKILVVDDETDLEILIKQKFRKKIRANDYEFLFAVTLTSPGVVSGPRALPSNVRQCLAVSTQCLPPRSPK